MGALLKFFMGLALVHFQKYMLLRKAADGIVPPREAVNGRATAYEQSFLQIDVEEKFQVH